MKKFITVILLVVLLISAIGCSTQADRVAYNLSQQADNFNIVRRLLTASLAIHCL